MADSSIEWTDATWNPVRGCKPVSPGCANCYAELMTGRLEAMGQDGYAGLTKPGTGKKRFLFNGEFRTAPDRLEDPLRWKKPRMVFVNSMSDLFGEGVSSEYITMVFDVMAACPQHTFQVLTKRPERMLEYFEHVAKNSLSMPEAATKWPLPNVWLGVSVENNDYVSRIEKLLRAPAAVRFLSLEPLLGPINLRRWTTTRSDGVGLCCECCWKDRCDQPWHHYRASCPHCKGSGIRSSSIDWVIVGGESGPNARPCGLRWIADIVAQCKAAGVPCFVKQLGSNAWYGGKRIKLSGKGGDRTEWPAECQEWPREWPRKVAS